MPRCPTRSSLCTDPGRSTTTTRRPPRWAGSIVGVEAAGHDDVGDVRGVAGGVEGTDRVDRQRLDRLGPTRRQATVRHTLGEDLVEEPLVGEAPRLGTGLEDVVQPLGLQPVELTLVQPRRHDHLGQQLEPRIEVLPEGDERGARTVPGRLAADLDPEPLGRLREGGCVERPRPGDEQLSRQCRDAGLCLVLGRGARIGEQMDADELALGERHEPDAEPVRQDVADDVGEAVGARRAGNRSGDHGAASAGT
jgi:hypothetical protein